MNLSRTHQIAIDRSSVSDRLPEVLAFSLVAVLASTFVPNVPAGVPLLAALIAAAALLYGRQASPGRSHVGAVIAGAMALYFLTCAATVIYHGDRLRELDKAIRFALGAVIVLAASRSGLPGRSLWPGLAASGCVALGYALFDRFYNGTSRVGEFMNSIQYAVAATAVATVCLALALHLHPLPRWGRLLLAVGGVSAEVAALMTGSLTPIPAFLLVGVLLFLVDRRRLRQKIAVATFAVLAATILVPLVGGPVLQRADDAVAQLRDARRGNYDSSNGARIANFINAVDLFRKAPVWGVGAEGYREARELLVQQGHLAKFPGSFYSAHNEYLDALAKRGAVGLAGTLALLLAPMYCFWLVWRRGTSNMQRAWALAGVVGMLVVAFSSLTQTVLGHGSGSNLVVALLAVCAGRAARMRGRP